MSLFFIFNNAHLAVSLFGALAFFMIAWLSFDIFVIRKDLKTFCRAAGFSLLVLSQLVAAFTAESLVDTSPLTLLDQWLFTAGLVLVAVSYLWSRRSTVAILAAAVALVPLGLGLELSFEAFDLAIVLVAAILVFWQLLYDHNRSLIPLIIGFVLLAASRGFLAVIFYSATSDMLFGGYLVFEFLAFLSLLVWSWQFLVFRIREEMTFIFSGMALLIATVVTVAFSSILITQVTNNAMVSLATSVKVMDLAINSKQSEALAKVKLIAQNEALPGLVAERKIDELDLSLQQELASENLDFLMITDEVGEVVKSVPSSGRAGDNFRQTVFGSKAMLGESVVTISGVGGEPLAIVAASPIIVDDVVIGILVGGFKLDNVFVDNLQKVTGLGASIYSGVDRVATTEVEVDGTTRLSLKETNQQVVGQVLGAKNGITLQTTINSRPYLASYLPLSDVDGNTVGMLAATQLGNNVVDLAAKTNQLTFIIVVALMLIIAAPIYFIAKRLSA